MALARPGLPDNAETFASRDIERRAFNRMDGAVRRIEIDFEVSDGKNGVGHAWLISLNRGCKAFAIIGPDRPVQVNRLDQFRLQSAVSRAPHGQFDARLELAPGRLSVLRVAGNYSQKSLRERPPCQ